MNVISKYPTPGSKMRPPTTWSAKSASAEGDGRLAPDSKEMLVSVRDEIGLTAIAKMSYVCSMRDKVFAEVGIPTLCTDSRESRDCTWASDMEFLGPSINTSVLSRQQVVFVKSWLCTSG